MFFVFDYGTKVEVNETLTIIDIFQYMFYFNIIIFNFKYLKVIKNINYNHIQCFLKILEYATVIPRIL